MVDLKPILHRSSINLLIQVHDELIFEVPYDEIYLVPQIVKTMEDFNLRVPIEAEVEWSGRSWGHKEPWIGGFEWSR